MRNVAPERESRLEKKKKVARESAAKRLEFHVAREQVTRIGCASRRSTPCACRLRECAAAEVRLIVRGSHRKVGVAANPISREEQAAIWIGRSRILRRNSDCLRASSRSQQQRQGTQY